MTALASPRAFSTVSAPTTLQVTSLVAPSPSAAIFIAICVFRVFNASTNSSKAAPSEVISAFPAFPFAKMSRVSFVEVSPSIETQL